jgi:uncharacterized protein
VLGAPQPCARLRPGVERPGNLAFYREGCRLDGAVTEAHEAAYPETAQR